MKRFRKLLPCIIGISLFLITSWAYAATFIVDSLGDVDDGKPYKEGDGNNTLRKCIRLANENADEPDTINFGISGTIFPTSTLPTITDDDTVIDASSQWDGAWPEGQPGITLDGNGAGSNDGNGLRIDGADDCHIRGLFITNFEANGVAIHNSGKFNLVGGTGEGYRNIISGNNWSGVAIGDSGTDNNVISGNYIGTDVSGTAALGNSRNGIQLQGGAQANIIGGSTPDERNIISGNSNGVSIHELGTDNNIISGNYIGTDVSGTVDLGNSSNGIVIYKGQYNIIGGTTEGERNIISGNDLTGVKIRDSGANNKVLGNYIGMDVSGTDDLGNSGEGVSIDDGAQSNIIGGTAEGERNIISGNDYGVAIRGSETNNNKVCGNYIGTDVTGTDDLGNSKAGVYITHGPQSNIIGGTTDGERNIISGNDDLGVDIHGEGADKNQVLGNYIGTDVSGTAAMGNLYGGVYIAEGAQSNIIGEGNLISGNHESGVFILGTGTDKNQVLGNYIGTDVTGKVDLGNSESGVLIRNGAQSNAIGGTTEGERNIISGNDRNGVDIRDSGTDGNKVSGNYIGTDVTGKVDLGNLESGVLIRNGAQSNAIGGTTEGERNIISGNGYGVIIHHSETNNNKVCGNYIGTDVTGTDDLGNSKAGVYITHGPQSNIIGGTTDGERNIISGNDDLGVDIHGEGADKNQVLGNYIGTDVSGTVVLGNPGGVYIAEGAQSNIIGGITAFERNIISGNKAGVIIDGSETNNNKVIGNYIGVDVSGTTTLGDSEEGVIIRNGAQLNTIGGTTDGERNIISGNSWVGIHIFAAETKNNKIIGNYIGTDATGTVALGNGEYGILITQRAQSNIIGGTTDGERNIIAGNEKGVVIGDTEDEGNIVSGNYIGPNPPPKTGDVSGDRTISAYDAALILRYVVGLMDEFPADSMVSPSAISPRSYIVEIPELSARAGDRIHVPIVINNATGLWAGGISLKYDGAILKAINVLTDITLNGSYWKANTELDGEVRFAFATTEPAKGRGNLLMVEFEVLPNTEGKTSRLIVENVNLSNSLNVTKINGSVTVIPSTFALLQNYPNPFNPDTWIPFELATDASVTINIYNAKGQLIRTIVLGSKAAGMYLSKDKAAYWDGRDDSGEKVSSGVYYYTLRSGEFTATRKLVVMK